MIHSRTVDKLVQFKDQQVIKKKEDDRSNKAEKILQDMITGVHNLLDKMFVFFMGILPGSFVLPRSGLLACLPPQPRPKQRSA